MALTTIEQLQLLQEGFDNLTQPLESVVQQQALNTATEFLQNQKDTAPGGVVNPQADTYLRQVGHQAQQILTGQAPIFRRLTALAISKVAVNTAANYATVKAATEAQVVGFLASNMLGIFEDVAGIRPAEKTAYDNL